MEKFLQLMGMPVLASEHGTQIDYFLVYVHWLMLILFIGWGGYFCYAVWKFHEKKNPKADYKGVQGHASTYGEIAVVFVEAVLLIGLSIPLWAKVVEGYPQMMRPGFVTSEGTEDTVAQALVDPFGPNNAFLVSAKTPGEGFNEKKIDFLPNPGADTTDAIATYDGQTIRVMLQYEVTTANQIVTAINELEEWTASLKEDMTPTPDPEKKLSKAERRENNGSGIVIEPTTIRVVAEQFTWNSRYPGPDGVFGSQDYKLVSTENKFGYDPDDPFGKDDITPPLKDLRVPLNKPAIIFLSSLDVIHSFAVHPLRVTQDCIPGMTIPTHFIPTKKGKYTITCAQLCGNGHFNMNGFITVEEQADFDAWLAENAQMSGGADSFE